MLTPGTPDEDVLASQRRRRIIVTILAGFTLGMYVLVAVIAGLNTHNRIGLGGAPLFYDFSVFHQAGTLANSGHAGDAYDDGKMIAAQHAAFPGSTLRLPWNYPPTFLLMLMPLAALPYVVAWLVWSCALYIIYALMARRLVRDPYRVWVLLLAPGIAVNLFFGQNGILSVVLLGGGVFLLRSRPVFAGVLLGLMAYKPQLALLVPLALLAGREWRALIAAVVSEAALMMLSVLVFGIEPWVSFLKKLVHPDAVVSSSTSGWRTVPSVATFAKTLGASSSVASLCHWTIAVLATAAAAWVWWKIKDGALRAAVLAAATLLVTPYLRAYDLALLVLPMAALLSRTQISLVEIGVLLAAWLAPAALMFMSPSIQFGPIVSLLLLAMLLLRVSTGEPARAAT